MTLVPLQLVGWSSLLTVSSGDSMPLMSSTRASTFEVAIATDSVTAGRLIGHLTVSHIAIRTEPVLITEFRFFIPGSNIIIHSSYYDPLDVVTQNRSR